MHCIIFIIGLINSSDMTSISSLSLLVIAAFKSLLTAASGDTQFQLNTFSSLIRIHKGNLVEFQIM